MPTEKVSLTLDPELLKEARATVGGRGLSGYVNHALQRQLQRDRIARHLTEFEKEHGSFDPEMVEEVRSSWPATPPAAAAPQRRTA
jgi:hypothetical protein